MTDTEKAIKTLVDKYPLIGIDKQLLEIELKYLVAVAQREQLMEDFGVGSNKIKYMNEL
jgi:hypothetical protein